MECTTCGCRALTGHSFSFFSDRDEPNYNTKMLHLSDNYNVGIEKVFNMQSLVITCFFVLFFQLSRPRGGKKRALMDPAGGSKHSGCF